jgi:hypothetical protein
MMVLMNSRTHKDIYINILKEMPKTFGFEFASVLFSEDSQSLYTIEGDITNSDGGQADEGAGVAMKKDHDHDEECD